MADSLDIKVTPTLDEVKRSVEARRKQLANFKTPYSRAAVFLDQWVQRNFKSQGDKFGGWKPFAQTTIEYMAKYDPGRAPAKLLQKTGRLRISFQPFASDDDAGIGTKLPYSKIHEKGSGRIPARPMLPTQQLVMADIRHIFKDFTSEVIVR